MGRIRIQINPHTHVDLARTAAGVLLPAGCVLQEKSFVLIGSPLHVAGKMFPNPLNKKGRDDY
jgi:hypothetical protein|eukprot:COSAG01_NODE_825_length_13294_cov_30.659038_2_plen_63_part_00